jgi:L-fuconolactonase
VTAGRVDAHHHVWDLDARDQKWLTDPGLAPINRSFGLADLAPAAAAAGVTATVLVQVLNDTAETVDFLALAASHPLVAGVVGWVDLTGPDVPAALAALRAAPGGGRLAGIRHLVQSEPDPDWLARTDVLRGLAAVAEAGLVYDLLTLPHQLAAATTAVRARPDLTFVVDHLSKPPIAAGSREPWAAAIRTLAAEPNVHCKLSGMVTEAGPDWTAAGLRPYAEVVLDAFGPARVMFGSDWPVCLLAAGYADVAAAAGELTAGLSAAERDDVFAGTATRVYRLSV